MNEPIIPGQTPAERGAAGMEVTPDQWLYASVLIAEDGTLEFDGGRNVIVAKSGASKARIQGRADGLNVSIKWSGLTGVVR